MNLAFFFLQGSSAQQNNTNDFVSEVSVTSQTKHSFDSESVSVSRTSSFSRDISMTDSKAKEANSHVNQKEKGHRKVSGGSNLTTNLNNSEADIRKKKLKRKSKYLKKEIKAARSLFIVLGAFALCWLPVHIHNAMLYFNEDLSQPAWFSDFAIILSHTNSLINPVIYAFRLKEMRNAFEKLCMEFYQAVKSIFCCYFFKSLNT